MYKTYITILLLLIITSKVHGITIQNDSIFNHIKSELQKAEARKDNSSIILRSSELGDFYQKSGLFTDAINQYNNALNLLEDIAIKDTIYVAINNKLGNAYLSLNNYNSAQSFFEVAEQIATNINFTRGKANAKANLGASYEKKSEYLKAMQYEQESLELYKLLNDEKGTAKSFENIGSIYEDLMQFDKAFEYFKKSYEILKGTSSFNEANVLNNIGDVYRKRGDYKTAISYTYKALELAQRLNDINLLESANKDLAKAYALLGNYQKAYQYRVTSEEFKEKSIESQNSSKLFALQAEHEFHKKEAEIALLKEQRKLSDAHQKLMIFALVSITSIFLLLFYFFNKKRKENQKIQAYKERTLKAELEKKQLYEAEMQKSIKIKTASLTKYSLSLSNKNKTLADIASKLKNLSKREGVDFKKKIKEMAKTIEFNLKQADEMEEFNELFSEINPDFSKKLIEKATDKLTSAELKLAMLLRLNLSSKEIASILKVTPDSVRVARHRLRKKLPINSKKELVNFMLEI